MIENNVNEFTISKFQEELDAIKRELKLKKEELRITVNKTKLEARSNSSLYDFAPIGHFKLNKNGCIKDVNKYGAKILGTTISVITNSDFKNYIAPESLSEFDDLFQNLVNTNVIKSCEIQLLLKNKQVKFVHISCIYRQKQDEYCF
jgi:hypothetical protein